jgi:Concanavalin A-like lectin/glucanases superfamily/Domain of unknown function (DUF2341)
MSSARSKSFTLPQKFMIVLAFALLTGGAFAIFRVSGGTIANLTLATQNATEDGLVGHWTFDGGDMSSAGGVAASWYSDYGYRQPITIVAGYTTGIATTSTSYPVLATSTRTDLKTVANGGKVQSAAGWDIVFADSNGTKLKYEQERYDPNTGEIAYWINASVSSTSNQTIYMYYGKSGLGAATEEPTLVWPDYYKGVWHMDDDPASSADGDCAGSGETCDSTANNNDATSANLDAADAVAGQIATSTNFDAEWTNINNTGTNLDVSSFTLSGWMWFDSVASQHDPFGRDNDDNCVYYFEQYSSGSLNIGYNSASSGCSSYSELTTATGVVTAGAWYHIQASLNTDTNLMKIYVNGVERGSISDTSNVTNDPTSDLNLGAASNDGQFAMDGKLDEFRLANIALTHADAMTEYNMQVNNAQVMQFGSEEPYATTVTTARDRSSSAKHGTVTGALAAEGRIGQGFSFDGSDDFVDVGEGPSSVRTVAFWARTSDLTQDVIDLNGTDYIHLSGGTVTAQAFDTPSVYVDGIAGSAFPSDGNWHHVAVTTATAENASDLDIGRREGSTYFVGDLDDVRLYSKVLSADEINRLYKLGGTTKLNTTVNTLQTLESGLVAHWTMDGSNISSTTAARSILDRKGGYTGTPTSNPLPAPGRMGQALTFDGTDDYLQTTYSGLNTENNYTVALWVKPIPTITGANQIAWWAGDATENGFGAGEEAHLGVNYGIADCTNYCWTVWVDNSADDLSVDLTQTYFYRGIWQHVVSVVEGIDTAAPTIKVYLDGVLRGSDTGSGPITRGYATAFRIGRPGADTRYFPGEMDDVRIYNRALSAAEVQKLYRLGGTAKVNTTVNTQPDLERGLVGHWTFDGPQVLLNTTYVTAEIRDRIGGLHGNWLNHASTTVPGRLGQAVQFDGVNDYVLVPDNAALTALYEGQYTWAFWVKPNSFEEYNNVWGQRNSSTNQICMAPHTSTDPRWGGTTAGIHVCWVSAESSRLHTNSNNNVLAIGRWNHVAITYDGSQLLASRFKIYVDATDQTGSNTAESGGTLADVNPSITVIGNSGVTDNSEVYNGSIDDFRYYSRKLSLDEITRLYRLGR